MGIAADAPRREENGAGVIAEWADAVNPDPFGWLFVARPGHGSRRPPVRALRDEDRDR